MQPDPKALQCPGVQRAHSASLEGAGMVIPQQVKYPVDRKERELCLDRVAARRGLASGSRHRNDDVPQIPCVPSGRIRLRWEREDVGRTIDGSETAV